MNSSHMILFSDGGARGNPGHSGIGVVAYRDDGQTEFFRISRYIGETTNNQAEYMAIIEGLKKARENGVTRISCYLDSELVVKQLNGEYKVRHPEIQQRFSEVQKLLPAFVSVEFHHVAREKNAVADSLVNSAIDEYLEQKKGHL